jgi:hypothetical protein
MFFFELSISHALNDVVLSGSTRARFSLSPLMRGEVPGKVSHAREQKWIDSRRSPRLALRAIRFANVCSGA